MASKQTSYRLINLTRGTELPVRVRRADGLIAQTLGLAFRRSLKDREGLWLVPCNGIHTFGMRFPIDVIVLDRSMRVLNIIHALPPFRVLPPVPLGRSVIELAAGSSAGIAEGDCLRADPQG